MSDVEASAGRGRQAQDDRIVVGLQAYAAAQSELGREFARRMAMHPTDSAAIVEILRAEDRGTPVNPARLADRIGLTSGATSILLNRLETAGHISRRRGHADRRRVTLHSAQPVHDAAQNFFAPLAARQRELLNRYTPEELDLIESFITEFRGLVDGYVRPDEV